jgi:uncharacterized membrane protein
MDEMTLALIILVVSLASYVLEKRVIWLTYFSAVCMIVLVAICLTALRLIPNRHPIYDFFLGPMVPVILACMVIGLDVSSLRRIPRGILLAFGVGTLGTMIGGIIAALVGSIDQGPAAAKLAAQLTASYIGGGENAVAVRTILGTPVEEFVACFAVDNILTSIWMVATVIGVKTDPKHAKNEKNITTTDLELANLEGTPAKLVDFLLTLTVALACIVISRFLADKVGIMHPLLYLSLISFGVGQIPVLRQHLKQSYLVGSIAFAPFFFSMGAIADIHELARVKPTIAIMPIVVVAIHALFLFFICRNRLSQREVCLTSQSLIGGAGTAVALAQATNWKDGISIGLLLGIFGYIIANHLGISVYYVSDFLIRFMGG